MKWSWVSYIVTLAILYLAATRLDWVSLWNALITTDPTFLALALGTWGLLMLLKATKWKLLIRALNGKIGVWKSMKILWIGLFVSVITPGRLGDFVRAGYVKDQISAGQGVMAVVVDRTMDVLTLLILATGGLFFLSQDKGVNLLSTELMLVMLLGAFGGAYLILNKRFAKKIVYPLLMKIVPARFKEMLSTHGKQFYDALPIIWKNKTYVFLVLLCSTLAWATSIFFGWFIMQSLGLPLGLEVALLVVPVISLVEIIPVGVAGVGTRELASVVVMGAYAVSPEPAVLYSLMYFTLGYIPSFILGAWSFNTTPFPMEGGLKGFLAKFKKK